MTIQELDYFIEVARVGSIGQAGANLYVSPQAISKAIKNLENSLKHELFSRNSKGVRLTVFGEAFLQEVLPIMQSINGLSDFGKKYSIKEDNSLRVYLDTINSYSYRVNLFTQQYRCEHPGIAIRSESVRITSDQPLHDDLCDIMFLCNRPGLVNAQKCECFTLFSSNTVAIANRKHPICNTTLLHWSGFSGIPVFLRSEEVYYAQSIINKCVNSGFYPNLSYRGDMMLDPFYFVTNNDGIAFVPDFVAEFFMKLSPEICVLDFDTGIVTDYIFAVRRSEKKERKERIEHYINYVECRLKSNGRVMAIF